MVRSLLGRGLVGLEIGFSSSDSTEYPKRTLTNQNRDNKYFQIKYQPVKKKIIYI